MLDPANLIQALKPEGVEELQLAKLLVMDEATVNGSTGLSRRIT